MKLEPGERVIIGDDIEGQITQRIYDGTGYQYHVMNGLKMANNRIVISSRVYLRFV